MSVDFIDSVSGLSELCARLDGADRIGIDLEGDGLFRYRSRLCTMQLRVAESTVVVDTLAAWSPEAVAGVLGPDGPLKVIHDLGFDARLLREHGVIFGHVFDTALAARYLGLQASGLAALVKAYCGVEIDKGPQQADWGERPLPEDMLRYLETDVAHLFTLHDELSEALRRADVVAEYEAELSYLLRQALREPPPPGPPWRRVKGGADLDPVGQAILRELALVREEAARDADVPPFRILHDRALVALAQRRPRDAVALRKVRGAAKGRAGGLAAAWLKAVERGVAARDVPAEESDAALRAPPPTPQERARRKARHARLSAWRRETAQTREVDLQVVLPGHCLQELCGWSAEGPPELEQIDGLGEVRIERDGAAIVAAVAEADASVEAP